ncbi:MAG: hypothetical protein AAF909_09405 [Pseudomonadota bacterium]
MDDNATLSPAEAAQSAPGRHASGAAAASRKRRPKASKRARGTSSGPTAASAPTETGSDEPAPDRAPDRAAQRMLQQADAAAQAAEDAALDAAAELGAALGATAEHSFDLDAEDGAPVSFSALLIAAAADGGFEVSAGDAPSAPEPTAKSGRSRGPGRGQSRGRRGKKRGRGRGQARLVEPQGGAPFPTLLYAPAQQGETAATDAPDAPVLDAAIEAAIGDAAAAITELSEAPATGEIEPRPDALDGTAGLAQAALTRRLFGGSVAVDPNFGVWSPQAEPTKDAPRDGTWNGAPMLADALCRLAFGQVPPVDAALRLIAGAVDSPIAARILPECRALIERGARVALLFGEEPQTDAGVEAIAEISRALGTPRLDDFLRIADFPGAELCLEQAVIGDAVYWTGEALARRGPTPLSSGVLYDFNNAAGALDAARLRFASAWRLGGAPSDPFRKRVAAAARTY